MKENIFQAVLAAILAGAAAYFHVLLGPLVVLLIVIVQVFQTVGTTLAVKSDKRIK